MRSHHVLMTLLLLAPVVAGAHHSLAAYYDENSTVTVSGVVKQVQFTNPHVHVWVTVAEPGDGAQKTMDMEFTGTSFFIRKGLTRDFVKVGDRITCTGHPGRNGLDKLRPTRLVLADGTEIQTRVVNPTAGAKADADADDR